MGAAALIMLREGLEASLVVAILLGYLHKVGQPRSSRYVWLGVAGAVAASLALAQLFSRFAGGFEGRAEQLFEGAVMLLATGVLTSMILWMQGQARHLRGRLEARVDRALSSGQLLGLASLAFVAVTREGVESVLFLGAVFFLQPDPTAMAGALVGLAAAVAIAYAMVRASLRLNLQKFFFFTGALLVALGAGLLAGGVHELQEAAILPVFVEHVWDMSAVLPEQSVPGQLLKALFGYNADPSLLEVLGWLAYVGTVGARYFGATRVRPAVSPAPPAAA
ncbi:MAG: FTR1 family protein [Limnochordaceae bacterium]|nr:FTR1 family protein [Limnochordaceae bacterium]